MTREPCLRQEAAGVSTRVENEGRLFKWSFNDWLTIWIRLRNGGGALISPQGFAAKVILDMTGLVPMQNDQVA